MKFLKFIAIPFFFIIFSITSFSQTPDWNSFSPTLGLKLGMSKSNVDSVLKSYGSIVLPGETLSADWLSYKGFEYQGFGLKSIDVRFQFDTLVFLQTTFTTKNRTDEEFQSDFNGIVNSISKIYGKGEEFELGVIYEWNTNGTRVWASQENENAVLVQLNLK